MSLTMELLYHYFVGPPQPDRWPEELQSNPAAVTACTPLSRVSVWACSWR